MTLWNPTVGQALLPEGLGAEGPRGPGVPPGRQRHTEKSQGRKQSGARGGTLAQAGDARPRCILGHAPRARGTGGGVRVTGAWGGSTRPARAG